MKKPSASKPTADIKTEEDAQKDEDGEYKFNLGLFRIEDMNDIIKGCVRKYYKAWTKKEERYVREYQSLVNVLYCEAYVYMDDETDFEFEIIETSNKNKQEVLRQILDEEPEYENEEQLMEHLKQIRSVYLGIRELIKKIGMDVPKEETVGQTDIFNQ